MGALADAASASIMRASAHCVAEERASKRAWPNDPRAYGLGPAYPADGSGCAGFALATANPSENAGRFGGLGSSVRAVKDDPGLLAPSPTTFLSFTMASEP